MGYSLSFAEDFFIGQPDGELGREALSKLYPVTPRPQSVMQALVYMAAREPAKMMAVAGEVLGYSLHVGQPIDDSLLFDLLEAARKHNYCSSLQSPIDVYLNDDHYVTVYEDREEEVA